jgi:alpha-galactosidase
MDNTFVGNKASISGLSDVQRYTQAIHWLGAGANLITGSDLTRIDTLGNELLFDLEALNAAAFTANYPIQPRNPGSGGNDAKQLQAWIAGPNCSTAIVCCPSLPHRKHQLILPANRSSSPTTAPTPV